MKKLSLEKKLKPIENRIGLIGLVAVLGVCFFTCALFFFLIVDMIFSTTILEYFNIFNLRNPIQLFIVYFFLFLGVGIFYLISFPKAFIWLLKKWGKKE